MTLAIELVQEVNWEVVAYLGVGTRERQIDRQRKQTRDQEKSSIRAKKEHFDEWEI